MTDDSNILSGIVGMEIRPNRLHMRQLVPAWKELIESATNGVDKQFLEDVLRLFEANLRDVHLYIQFIGD